MHDAMRARAVADLDAIEKAMQTLRESRDHSKLTDQLAKLEQYVAARRKQLA